MILFLIAIPENNTDPNLTNFLYALLVYVQMKMQVNEAAILTYLPTDWIMWTGGQNIVKSRILASFAYTRFIMDSIGEWMSHHCIVEFSVVVEMLQVAGVKTLMLKTIWQLLRR